ncbi:MAG TPA: YggT family protein [Spirochaetota bacterium]|nr:YggT family protein [Spirochaetota bacterium]HOM38764.1 YggT family protein [Spirochaetota bacterium]HPQ49562.1 YggT family protein [Spirochaetota bacterium]
MIEVVLKPILLILRSFLNIYELILIARIILSWFVRDYYSNPLLNFIYSITEPVLIRVRNTFRFLVIGFLDLSVIVVFILLNIAKELIDYIILKLYFVF